MSVLTRWTNRRTTRKALLVAARARAAYWRTRKRHALRGTKTFSRAAGKLAAAEELVAKRKLQVAYADRVIARHTGPSGPVKGIDISNNNGTVNLTQVAAAGYTFVFCKATEGTTFRDGHFAANAAAAKAAGLLVGAYHFLHHGNADAQAAAFVAAIKTAGCTLRPVCDVETAGCTEADVAEFVRGVEKRLSVTPLIYTSPGFMRWSSTHGCDLWVAHYGVAKPSIPSPWNGYAIWQHTSTATVPGVSGNCDTNLCTDLSKIKA